MLKIPVLNFQAPASCTSATSSSRCVTPLSPTHRPPICQRSQGSLSPGRPTTRRRVRANSSRAVPRAVHPLRPIRPTAAAMVPSLRTGPQVGGAAAPPRQRCQVRRWMCWKVILYSKVHVLNTHDIREVSESRSRNMITALSICARNELTEA